MQFLCRPGKALRVSGGWSSQISRQSAHEGEKVVSPTHWPPYPRRNISGTVRGWVDRRVILQLEGLCKWKIPVTPSGIETVTFWLVEQCLNQVRYHVPLIKQYSYLKCSKHEIILKGNVKFSPSFGIMVARWNCTSSITTERSSCELPCSLANVFHTRVCEAEEAQTVSLYSRVYWFIYVYFTLT